MMANRVPGTSVSQILPTSGPQRDFCENLRSPLVRHRMEPNHLIKEANS